MRVRILLLGFAVVILIALFIFAQAGSPATSRVTVSFLGYTNLPKGETISALVSINNYGSTPVRFDLSAEDERTQEVRVVVTPPTTASPLPAGGTSTTYAVGAPLGRGKWRVRLRYFRCTPKEKLYYFGWNHKVPQKLEAVSSSSLPKFIYPSPYVTHSVWLTR